MEKVINYYRIDGVEEKEGRIREYMRMLESRRKWAGLTSKKFGIEAENVVIDTLGILKMLSWRSRKAVVDIGSGGGIVGIVISIVCLDWDVLMVESSARKAAFLAEAVGLLGLGNARVERERAERMAGCSSFELALSRATGELRKIAPTALGMLRTGGIFIAIKGSRVESEVQGALGVIEASGGEVMGVEKPTYPEDFGIPDRVSHVLIRKI